MTAQAQQRALLGRRAPLATGVLALLLTLVAALALAPAGRADGGPVVTGVSPADGPAAGGSSVTITGSGFTDATDVFFGGTDVPLPAPPQPSDTSLTVTAPVGTDPVDVTVLADGVTSATSAADIFTFDPATAPTVTAVAPDAGPTGGGTSVTITGTGFTAGSTVDFGMLSATSVLVNSSTSITATSPAGVGTADVTVTTNGGASPISTADEFAYDPLPSVTGVSPSAGPTAGGTTVTISGTGFTTDGQTSVSFGSTPLSPSAFTVNSSSSITATAPAGTNTVDVTVSSPGGTSSTSSADQYTYDQPPTVTGVSPSEGPQPAGTAVTISGTNFTTDGTTSVALVPASGPSTQLPTSAFTVTSASSITATLPAGSGTDDIVVTTPGGSSATSSADQYTYDPIPSVTTLTPDTGPLAGGTLVTIAGAGFTTDGTTNVAFGSTILPASAVTVNSSTSITVISPPSTVAGQVPVIVTTPGGASSTTGPMFTYLSAPAVTRVDPAAGPIVGGTIVTISGTGFSHASAVDFGSLSAPFTVNNDGSITATAPAATSAGPVDVTVTAPGGTSATSSADQFTYDPIPTVVNVSPNAGPLAGGTGVTITGTGFASGSTVSFGGTAGTSVVVVNATTITAKSPAGTGTVDITVTTPGGTSTTSSADQFGYDLVPTVTSIAPSAGPVTGGTVVTITGTNFTTGSTVSFGGTAGTLVDVLSPTTLTATSPGMIAGTVDVTVSTPGGTSATSSADRFTFDPAPTVTGVTPNAGPLGGGTAVTITGTGFTSGSTVAFGGSPATSVTVVNQTTITAMSPAGTGTVDVTVATPGGTSGATSNDRFTYDPVPTVTAVNPNAGPLAGGTAVTITGTGFAPGSTVSFGGSASTLVSVKSSTSIVAASPAGATTGPVDVTITSPGGTSATSAADQFTYDPVPTVTGIAPGAGPLGGGTVVTITGTGFAAGATVAFSGTAATAVVVTSSTSMTATSPAATAVGRVDVTVMTPGGTSVTSSADRFTYDAVPTVSAVSPNSGPLGGGTGVTITGTGFTSGSSVSFGATAGTSVTVVSATTITATSPAGGAGAVDVTVTTPGGTSPASSSDQFTYDPLPTVSAVAPNAGPLGGGTTVTISGSGFTSGATVAFNGTAATAVSYVNATTLTAKSPAAGAGTVDVQVTTPGGTSTKSPPGDQFTYTTGPTVASIAPSAGPLAGGTTVTIDGSGFTSGSTVSFGGSPATVVGSITATVIKAKSPAGPGSGGSVHVTVTTAGGTSSTSTADLYTYDPVPTVSNVSPAAGPTAGATTVTITGSGFVGGATSVSFGATAATAVTVVNPTTITAASPGEPSGTVQITVTTPGGSSGPSAADQFTYDSPPTVSGLNVIGGPVAGGTPVTINGSGFTVGSTVAFGHSAATTVTVSSSTSITAVSPPGTAGAVDVTVSTPGGTSATSAADQFMYAATPTVTNVSPGAGPLAGGSHVTITGTGFTPKNMTVSFGTVQSSAIQFESTSSIVVLVPAAASTAQVDVTVTTVGGTSPATAADRYSYDPIPTVTAVSPSTGPPSGGTAVTITGTGFTPGATVSFGTTAAGAVTVVNATTITADSAGAAGLGPVDVTVTTPGGTSATSGADQFTYLQSSSAPTSVPAVTGISPAAGPVAGGTSVTIAGGNFTGASGVSFGSAAATSYTVVSDSEIVAISPAGAAGAAGVTVSNAAGSSPAVAGATFTYAPPPTVIAVRVGSLHSAQSVLAATIDDGGVAVTSCTFDYGTTAKYGRSVDCTSSKAAATGPISVSATLKSLSPATTYHYRLKVSTAAGTIETTDARFTTPQLPLLQAPLVGLVVQRSAGHGPIGQLLGIQGIQHGVAGESIEISCVKACARKTSLTIKRLKAPLNRVKATLGHALSLSKATRIEIRVSKGGNLGRYAVYAFSASGSQISVALVKTGCLGLAGKVISCRMTKASTSDRSGSEPTGAEPQEATDVVGVLLEQR